MESGRRIFIFQIFKNKKMRQKEVFGLLLGGEGASGREGVGNVEGGCRGEAKYKGRRIVLSCSEKTVFLLLRTLLDTEAFFVGRLKDISSPSWRSSHSGRCGQCVRQGVVSIAKTHSRNERHVHPSIFTYLPAWSYPGKVQEREAKMRMAASVRGMRSRQVRDVNNLNTLMASVHHHTTTAADRGTVRIGVGPNFTVQ